MKKLLLPPVLAIFGLTLLLACGEDDKGNPLAPLRDPVQITLNSGDVTMVTEDQAMSTLLESGVSIPAGGENQKWDYRRVPVKSNETNAWDPLPASPAFPGSLTCYPTTYGLLGFDVPAVEYAQKDADFYQYPGFTIAAIKLNLDVAGTSYIDVEDQVVPYAPARKALHFPMAFGNPADVFASSVRTINGKLTHALLGFDKTPVGYQVTYDRTNTIIGWGLLALPNYAEPFDVLLVKADIKLKNEMFLNGVLATQDFLTPFGLTQGLITEYTRYQFYAKGNPQPVLTIEVQDGLVTYVFCMRTAVNGE
jgi:hypothetical protein